MLILPSSESIGKFIISSNISKDIIFGYFDFDADKKSLLCYQFNLFYWEILYP